VRWDEGEIRLLRIHRRCACLKRNEAFPAAGESAAMARAKPGDKPAGVVGRRQPATQPITAIDKKGETATLKGEDGKS